MIDSVLGIWTTGRRDGLLSVLGWLLPCAIASFRQTAVEVFNSGALSGAAEGEARLTERPLLDAGPYSPPTVQQPLGDGFPVDLGFQDFKNGGRDKAPKQFTQPFQRPAGELRELRARRVDADWRAGEIKSHPLVACGTVDRVVRFTDAKPQSHPDIACELRPAMPGTAGQSVCSCPLP